VSKEREQELLKSGNAPVYTNEKNEFPRLDEDVFAERKAFKLERVNTMETVETSASKMSMQSV
jgi:hypothetical protein